MDEKILIDRKTLKAISSDTRFKILKLLNNRKYTLSEISKKLNLTNTTIKEHLDGLIESDLILKINDSRKWKYYSLTTKGKKLIKPKEIKVILTFLFSFLSFLGMFYIFLKEHIINEFSKKVSSINNTTLEANVLSETPKRAMDLSKTTTFDLNFFILLFVIIFLLVITIYFLRKYIKGKKL